VGSTLKPFLYGLALERRLLTPASLLTDAPLELPQADGLYRPQNYDDRALDPDIPSSRQRTLFEAEPAGASARWALNGEDLGPTTRVVAWRPQPGTHTLSLVDGERGILDTVAFEVRGCIERIDD
jgi:membrane carboxypeptidase/penicillin-binding protein PbpC